MNNKVIKILFKIALFLIIFSIICSSIISQDTYHLEICHDEDCIICTIIHIAINIINIIFEINISIFFMFLIMYILAKIHKEFCIVSKNTLLFQKVMFNE